MHEEPTERRSGGGAFIAIFLFLLPWTLLVLSADAVVAYNCFRQLRALGFSSTEGRILQCRLKPVGGGAVFDLQYTYLVSGIEYTCSRYRYFGLNESQDFIQIDMPESQDSLRARVDSLPVQSSVKVFYDPADPSDALLKPGLSGAELFVMTFLAAFNAATLAGWASLWIVRRNDPPFDMRFSDDGSVARARLNVSTPLFAAFGYAGGMGLILSCIIGAATGGDASLPVAFGSWIGIVGAAVYGWRHEASNPNEIVIDRTGGTLTLPKHKERKQPLTVDLDSIAAVAVRKTTEEEGSQSYVPVVVLRDEKDKRSEEPIMSSSEKAEARHLTKWLRTSLGLQE